MKGARPADTAGAKERAPALKFLPLALIALGAAAFFLVGGQRYLSLAALAEHYAALVSFVDARFFTALALYMLVYIAVVALSLPGATLMSLVGGFLFGTLVATGAVVVAATIGATIIFLAARTAFGEVLRKRAKGFLARMEEGFRENAFSYLLLLRLIPLFPFFIVNIAPALADIPIRTFVAATFIGIMPGAFAYVSAGNGLGAVLERGEELNLSGLLLEPEILIPIVALALLALLPIAYRAVRKSREGRAE
jgi:uncharacterized membrane protein YdjX (TVP38/TMEM64 family)